MAILPINTNSTVAPFIPHTGGTQLPQQGKVTPIEQFLSEAIHSLRNNDPARSNEFIKQLQQVSPTTANRIFHLTWERSGKPLDLGDRFGEEAFFGYWGRSIDSTVKLEILSQVLEEAAVPPMALGIPEIALAIFSRCDLQTFGRLASVNQFLNACVKTHDKQLNLDHLCPNLQILNAEAQELRISDEPRVSNLWILKNYTELAPHVENGEGLTLLTMPQGRTLNQLIAIAREAGMDGTPCFDQIVKKLGDVPVEQTYIILITNSVFQQSRNKSYVQQQELVARHTCVMPTVQEYVALCVFTNKVFQKCLYGQTPWTFGRTSMQIDGYCLAVGGSAPACPFVHNSHFDTECDGAGGQRKLYEMHDFTRGVVDVGQESTIGLTLTVDDLGD